MTAWLLRRFDGIDPAKRRLWAARLLVASLVLWVANRVLWLMGIVTDRVLDSITNDLSWLALTLTAVDVVFTSDVRTEQDD